MAPTFNIHFQDGKDDHIDHDIVEVFLGWGVCRMLFVAGCCKLDVGCWGLVDDHEHLGNVMTMVQNTANGKGKGSCACNEQP